MPTPSQYARAAAEAAKKGDTEAANYFRQKSREGYQAEVKGPTEEMSGLERFTAGVGQGAVNVGRQLGRVAGQLTGDRVGLTAEDMARAKQIDQPLLSTGAGGAGAMLGEVLATAPVGGLAAAGARQGLGRAGLTGARRALGTMAGAGAAQGAAEGALMAGEGERLRGAAAGGAGGALIPMAGQKLVKAVSRGVEASAPARALMRQGVDLTPGQMNPRSAFGQMEEVSTNLPFVGPSISRAREASKQDWQRLLPGAATAPGQPRATTLEGAFESFEPAYAPAKGIPVYPKQFDTGQPLASFPKVRGLFEDAVRDRGVMADANTRKTVNSWLQNKLTQLPGAGKKTIDTMPSDDLLKLRSDIRTQIRKVQDPAQKELLGNAERRLTDVLESQLPADATAALRSADRGYSQYKIVEDAMRRAGDQVEGVSPAQLSAAVRAATPGPEYARGGGGPLRQLASTGRQVFDVRTPPTGARLAVPLGIGYAIGAGPSAALAGLGTLAATTRGGRRILGGQTAAQKKARALELALRRKAGNVITPTSIAAGSTAARELTGD